MSAIQQIADFLKKGVPLFYTNTYTGLLMSFCDVTKSVTPLKNAVLEYFLRPGDIVMMNAEKDHVKDNIPNGTFGMVTGYYRYQRAVGYHELWASKKRDAEGAGVPGIFEKNGAAKITWINGETSQGHAGDIYNITDDTGHKREGAKEFEEDYERAVFIAALPELPIWPGDTVDLNKVFWSDPGSCAETTNVVVERVDYSDVDTKCSNGSPFPIYQIRPVDQTGPSTALREYLDVFKHPGSDDLVDKLISEIDDDIYITKIVKRGNYWAWFNDKSKISFSDLEEGIRFYINVGLMVQIENPKGGYSWTPEELDVALVDGQIAYARKSGRNYEAWNIPSSPELSKKIRDYILDVKFLRISTPSEEITRALTI